jgi:hypothetical protein
MVARTKSLDLGPFIPGVDNRRPEFKMKGDPRADKGDFLRFAVNADITAQGTVKRREGYTNVLAGGDCHSFWADGPDAFMVDGTTLKRITGLPGVAIATTMRTGLTPGRPVSYVRAQTSIYYSNGIEIGRLGATERGVSTPSLAVLPTATASGAGVVGALARYGVCFSYLDAAGEESAATTPTWVDAALGQSILITNLPAAFPSGAAALVVYMTLANDSTLQRARTLTAPSTSITLALGTALGARCPTLQLQPMPAGDIVRQLSGRLLVVKGSVLYYSEPYRLGLFNPTRGYLLFPSDITVVETTSGGVWVCADQTYWFKGLDIGAADLDAKAPYGGVVGSGGQVPNSNDVYWMSPRGVMRGTQEGVLSNLQEAHVAVAPSSFAANYFRENDGMKMIAESLFAVEPNRMAASSYMDAEIVRKKVIL